MYDFGSECAETYEEVCDCGKRHLISTQKDRHPEYTTDVYIKCDCGKSVAFELPVN